MQIYLGKISATSGDIGGFSIDTNTISSSNNNLILRDSGQITGSQVQFTGGKVGGWNINNKSIFIQIQVQIDYIYQPIQRHMYQQVIMAAHQ